MSFVEGKERRTERATMKDRGRTHPSLTMNQNSSFHIVRKSFPDVVYGGGEMGEEVGARNVVNGDGLRVDTLETMIFAKRVTISASGFRATQRTIARRKS